MRARHLHMVLAVSLGLGAASAEAQTAEARAFCEQSLPFCEKDPETTCVEAAPAVLAGGVWGHGSRLENIATLVETTSGPNCSDDSLYWFRCFRERVLPRVEPKTWLVGAAEEVEEIQNRLWALPWEEQKRCKSDIANHKELRDAYYWCDNGTKQQCIKMLRRLAEELKATHDVALCVQRREFVLRQRQLRQQHMESCLAGVRQRQPEQSGPEGATSQAPAASRGSAGVTPESLRAHAAELRDAAAFLQQAASLRAPCVEGAALAWRGHDRPILGWSAGATTRAWKDGERDWAAVLDWSLTLPSEIVNTCRNLQPGSLPNNHVFLNTRCPSPFEATIRGLLDDAASLDAMAGRLQCLTAHGATTPPTASASYGDESESPQPTSTPRAPARSDAARSARTATTPSNSGAAVSPSEPEHAPSRPVASQAESELARTRERIAAEDARMRAYEASARDAASATEKLAMIPVGEGVQNGAFVFETTFPLSFGAFSAYGAGARMVVRHAFYLTPSDAEEAKLPTGIEIGFQGETAYLAGLVLNGYGFLNLLWGYLVLGGEVGGGYLPGGGIGVGGGAHLGFRTEWSKSFAFTLQAATGMKSPRGPFIEGRWEVGLNMASLSLSGGYDTGTRTGYFTGGFGLRFPW